MLDNSIITNTDELEFAVFCIENIAIKLGKNAEEVYQALTEKSDILNSYIVPEYEILHTVELYFDNLIDKGEAIRRLRYEKPNLQICFRTQKALDGYLHYERSEQL